MIEDISGKAVKFEKAIGCSEKRVHDLRHSYAVASLHAGDDIKTVQGNLGHHTAAFTLQTHGHVTDDMRKESAAHMDSLLCDPMVME